MLLHLFFSDEDGPAMEHIYAHRDFGRRDQRLPIFHFFFILMDALHQDHAVIVHRSFGKKLFKTCVVQSVGIDDVRRFGVKMDIGKHFLDGFFKRRIGVHMDTICLEVGIALQQHIDGFVPVHFFSGIQALGHILEDKGGVYSMCIGGFKQKFQV